MGGWVTVMTAAHDHSLAGVILISAADMGQLGKMEHEKLVAEMADNMEGLAGVTAESMANEDAQNAKAFGFANATPGLKDVPMLVLSANDGLARRPTPLSRPFKLKATTTSRRSTQPRIMAGPITAFFSRARSSNGFRHCSEGFVAPVQTGLAGRTSTNSPLPCASA